MSSGKKSPRTKAIITALMRLNLANDCQKQSTEVIDFVEIIEPDLAGYSTEVIVMAIEEFKRSCKWWPKLAELIERAQAMTQSIQYEKQLKIAKLPLPTELSDKQRQLNIDAIKRMRQTIAKRRRMPA